MKVPAGKHLMDLVAVDWFKDTKRMDHVARHRGSAAQVKTFQPPPPPLLFWCCSFHNFKEHFSEMICSGLPMDLIKYK